MGHLLYRFLDTKKAESLKFHDISATRLSPGDPVDFPPHSREWFSIIVYHHLVYTAYRSVEPVGIKLALANATIGS
jgi:hypothetical protein